MTQKVAITTVALFIIGIVTFISVDDNADRVPVNSSFRLSDPPDGSVITASKVSGNFERPMSERKKRLKGLGKLDRPDLFAQYHRDIRTRHGEAAPSYSYNYRVEELLKAKSVTSTKALRKLSTMNQLDWVERGPGNLSGRTRSLIVDPDDSDYDTWYAGSVGGGVWKTEDAGKSWIELTVGLPNLATSTLAMAASNHNVIYVGTGEGFDNVDQIQGSGIWKSIDRGASWDQLASTTNLEFQNVTRIIVDPADENTLLVSTAVGFNRAPNTSGIHRSIDGGASWTKVYDSGGRFVQQIIANPEDFKIQYAAVNAVGVMKSSDAGLTWSPSLSLQGSFAFPAGRFELAVAPSDPARVFAALDEDTGTTSILYISQDAGATWVKGSDATGVNWLAEQGWYDNTIAVHPFNENVVFVGGVNLWRIDLGTGIDTTDFQVTGIDLENTSSFLAFINFGGALQDGGIDFGGASEGDYTSIEIRFGPGKSQKAHRFLIPAGETSGVPDAGYAYQDYVDVPFELWDSDSDVQLMVSFRDQTRNGVWELGEFDTNTTREYVFLSAEPYDPDNPHPSIARNAGHTHRQLYFIWPVLVEGGIFDPGTLPEATLRINWGRLITQSVTTTNVTDAYGQFGGSPKQVHPDHHNIVIIPIDEASNSFRLLNANDGGVSFSDDAGATFIQPLNGYNTTQFYGVDKKNGANEFIGGMQDNNTWRSPAGEEASASSRWTFQLGGDGFETVWHYTDPSKLLGSIQYNQIRRSLDGGTTWSFAVSGMDDVGTGAPFFTKLAKSKQDPDLVFAVGESGVWRTDDFASNWTVTPMPDGWIGDRSASEVKTSLVNPQIVWAGENMIEGRPLYVSTDGGLTFTETAVFPDVTLGPISGLETHPAEASTAFALFSFANAPKILETNDLGQTWQDISGFGTGTTSTSGFPDVAVYSLLVMPYDTDIIWAGTEIGIFESIDDGATWADANNGFPATLVYEMVIVNDQVVVATHGRGVWSVALPELAGYEPPVATLSPRLNGIGGGPGGLISLDVSLRSPYDSTLVIADGEAVFRLPANPADIDTNVNVLLSSVENQKSVTVSVKAFKDGDMLSSTAKEIVVFPLLQARNGYMNSFNSLINNDMVSNGLNVTEDFENRALHSPHNYAHATELTATLRVPIIVASADAILSYDDIAIVQPGFPGSVFGKANFRDFVVVEGRNVNEVTWQPLADGYDARFDAAWLLTFNGSGNGDPSMFRTHEIDLLDTFSAEETILIRFRLFTDETTNAWGWVVDNLSIQPQLVSVASNEQIPKVFSLSQNYPNPFNPGTQIDYTLPATAKVNLKIFNVRGQQVKYLVQDEEHLAGAYTVEWDGKDDFGVSVSSGVYFYRIEAGDRSPTSQELFVKSFKMTLLR